MRVPEIQFIKLIGRGKIQILQKLGEGPASINDLREARGNVSRAQIYLDLKPLIEIGYVARGSRTQEGRYYVLAKRLEDIGTDIIKNLIQLFFNGSRKSFVQAMENTFGIK